MRKIAKVFSVAIAPIVSLITFITGCFSFGKRVEVDVDNSGIMQDIDDEPRLTAAYEQYTKQVIDGYFAVENAHKDEEGKVDKENEEVINAANSAAAKLFAYACYNERTLDRYAFFSDQTGTTDLGNTGSAKARKQEYYLRVNESDKTCGYRYHYTIKKVNEVNGGIGFLKGSFESARIRFTDKTDLLYRFEGDTDTLAVSEDVHEKLGVNLLQCKWKTGSDWGKHDIKMVKSDFIAPDKIEEDIVAHAGEDNITIRGNVNILAENMVKNATIFESGEGYTVIMNLDTAVANSDEASLKMLIKGNSSGDCRWVADEDGWGPTIVFNIWKNGLFRFYNINECWSGAIMTFSGTVDSSTQYYYSYSERDCDMTANLEVLAKADAERNS